MSYVFSQRTPNVRIKFFVWLVDLQTDCAKYVLETKITLNDDIRKCLIEMKHGWIKNAL
jgi:hypothetical protein